MGQNLFKKHSNFQNFDEIFYCGMITLWYDQTQELFKKYLKLKKIVEYNTLE